MSSVLCPFLFSYILFCFRLSCLYPLCSFEMQEEIALYIIRCFTLQRILLSLFFYSFQHFFEISLSVLKRSLTFAAVKQLATTYQMNLAQQRNFDFFAFFSALYLTSIGHQSKTSVTLNKQCSFPDNPINSVQALMTAFDLMKKLICHYILLSLSSVFLLFLFRVILSNFYISLRFPCPF